MELYTPYKNKIEEMKMKIDEYQMLETLTGSLAKK